MIPMVRPTRVDIGVVAHRGLSAGCHRGAGPRSQFKAASPRPRPAARAPFDSGRNNAGTVAEGRPRQKACSAPFNRLDVQAWNGLRTEDDEGQAVLPSVPQEIQPSVASLQSDLGDHDVVVPCIKGRVGGVDIGHRLNPEIGLIAEHGADAFANDWMLVDYEKPNHVTETQLGHLEMTFVRPRVRSNRSGTPPRSLSGPTDRQGCQRRRRPPPDQPLRPATDNTPIQPGGVAGVPRAEVVLAGTGMWADPRHVREVPKLRGHPLLICITSIS